MLENVSKDVSKDLVDCTRVKDVLEVSVRPRLQGRGLQAARLIKSYGQIIWSRNLTVSLFSDLQIYYGYIYAIAVEAKRLYIDIYYKECKLVRPHYTLWM